MSKFKFVSIVDTFFITLAILLIIFAWVQFFVKNIFLSLVLSSIATLFIIFFMRYLKSKKQTKFLNNLSKTTEITKFKLALQTLSNAKITALIKRLIPQQYESKSIKNGLSFTKDKHRHIIIYNFDSELNEATLLKIVKSTKNNHITICCITYSNDVKYILNAFKNKYINLIHAEQLYEIFMQNNIVIDTSNIDLSQHKVTLPEVLKGIISRNKSKGYFLSGLIILFTSLIIPYKIYYVIFSTILFILSLVCRFKPVNTQTSKTLID